MHELVCSKVINNQQNMIMQVHRPVTRYLNWISGPSIVHNCQCNSVIVVDTVPGSQCTCYKLYGKADWSVSLQTHLYLHFAHGNHTRYFHKDYD